jgi:predicted transcriptional regulator
MELRLQQVVDLLDCEILCGQDRLDREIDCAFAADLMSDVLAYAQHGALLITGLSSSQSVHTAEIADLGAVLLVSNKRPADDALAIARRRGLPLLQTAYGMFEVCGLLSQHGLGSPMAKVSSSRSSG